jgi:hypothetical protein
MTRTFRGAVQAGYERGVRAARWRRRWRAVGDVVAWIGAMLVILVVGSLTAILVATVARWVLSDAAFGLLSLSWVPDWVSHVLRLVLYVVLGRAVWRAVRRGR